MLQVLVHDLRHALRILRKGPVLTAVAIVVIGIGTGAVTTIFSVANAIVLRPVPGVIDAARLAVIQRTQPSGGSLSASYPYYEQLAANSRAMSGVAAWSMIPLTISRGGAGESSVGNIVSANYFDVLGVRPALGRFFAGDETRVRDTYPVVVVSHGFWERELSGDSAAIGKPVFVNGAQFTVIGVAPARFTGLFSVVRTDAWVPLMMQRTLRPGGDLAKAGSAWLELFGRVAPGRSRADAQLELAALTRRFATAPSSGEPAALAKFTNAKLDDVSGLPVEATGAVIGFFAVLLVVSALVLMIASVNVAGMLMARAVARRREIAVRLALGASRARLIRQLLTESMTLFVFGGAAGVFIAIGGTRLLERIELPVDVPLSIDLTPDARVFAFTFIVAVATGALFGLAPALQATRADLSFSLRGDTAGGGRTRSRLRNALIVGQVAMSLVLLSASGLFIRALERARAVNPGFDADNVASTALNIRASGYDEARGRAFYRELAGSIAALPGVTAVGYARILPLSTNTSGLDISVDDYTPPGGHTGATVTALFDQVDEGYFATTRTPVLNGRGIRSTDDAAAPRVAVVNRKFAAQYFPGRDALGRTFRIDSNVVTVVGIVPDTKFKTLNERAEPFMYLPLAQRYAPDVNLLVRTAGDPAAFAANIRNAIRAIDPKLPVPTVTTLRQAVSVSLLPQRIAVAVTAVLGFAGLLLAAIGLYGVLSFSAAQRTAEIGVRMALGAQRRDVVRLVVGEGMRLVGIGMAAGLVLALAATRALTPFLFGVSPIDPVTFGIITVILGAASFAASYLPAARAASVDPADSLRRG